MKNNKYLLLLAISALLVTGCGKHNPSTNSSSLLSENISNVESISSENNQGGEALSDSSNASTSTNNSTSEKPSSTSVSSTSEKPSSSSVSSNKPSSSSSSVSTSSVSSSKPSTSSVSTSTNINVVYPDSTYTGTYYNGVNLDQTGASLKTALHKLINTKTVGSYDYAWTVYEDSDTDENGKLIDIYSSKRWDQNANKGNYKKEGDAINREHCVPQSVFNEASPMKADCHHLFPSDGYVNNRRSNYPFGYVSSTPTYSYKDTVLGTYKLGTGSDKNYGYTGTVFEPVDSVKGDIARATLYMATCYQDKISSWDYDLFSKNTYPSLSSWGIKVLLEWCALDPVSQREIDRNNGVYKHQKNRNPFVDHPSLVYKIWDPENSILKTDPQEKADVICDLISKIGTVTLQSGNDITAARTAYDKATPAVQQLVSNYNLLTQAETTYEALVKEDKINNVISLIDAIGTVTTDSKSKITAARTAYNALSSDLKALVTNYSKLLSAESTYEDLVNQNAANDIISKINAIGTVTVEKESLITAARSAYNTAGAIVQELVTNYQTLVDAEATLINLKKTKLASDFDYKVFTYGTVTLESKGDIEGFRKEYNAFADEVKELVTCLDHLVTLETKLATLIKENNLAQAISLVDSLPETITLSNKDTINSAKSYYDLLDEEQLVTFGETRTTKLEAALTTLSELAKTATGENTLVSFTSEKMANNKNYAFTYSKTPLSFESGTTGRGVQWSSQTDITIKTSGYTQGISSMKLIVSNNGSNTYTITVKVNGKTMTSTSNTLNKASNQVSVFSLDTPESGEIEINIKASASGKSFWLKSIEIN